MKKIKKAMGFALAWLLLATGALCGCQWEQNEEPQLLTNPVVILNDFETQADLSTTAMIGLLGKAELNQDAAYKTKGKSSVKLTVIHNPYTEALNPTFFQSVNLQKRQEDYSDFSKTSSMTADVYNANSTVEKLGIQMKYSSGYSLIEWFELAPNAWTTIRYKVPRESIPQSQKEGKNGNYIQGIQFLYERPTDADRVFYMDNVCLYKTSEVVEPLDKTLKNDEICSFDSWWQVASLTVSGGAYAPTISWVKDRLVTSDAALKVNAVGGDDGVWPEIALESDYCKMIDWASYGEDDTMAIDVYLPEGQEMEIALTLYANGIPFYTKQVELIAGQWNMISCTVGEIQSELSEGADGVKFSMTTKITLGYRGFLGTENRQIYFDNFRMERADVK